MSFQNLKVLPKIWILAGQKVANHE